MDTDVNVLCIGNSFSQDATRYLHQIARADGVSLTVVNLYIGGCSLEHHFRNLMGDLKKYDFSINGYSTGILVSIKEALLNRQWDIVTMQQVSNQSTDYSTYQPFLRVLSEYVRKYAPTARQVIQQTWAYRPDGPLLTETFGFTSHEDMYHAIRGCYEKAVAEIGATQMIPSGALINLLLKSGVPEIHRDQKHVTIGLGRYALGLLWYKALTGNDIHNNNFRDFDESVTEEEVALAKRCVSQIL